MDILVSLSIFVLIALSAVDGLALDFRGLAMASALYAQTAQDTFSLSQLSSPSIISLGNISDSEFSRLSELGTDDLADIKTSDPESSDSDWPIPLSLPQPRRWPLRFRGQSRLTPLNVGFPPDLCGTVIM